MRLTLGLFGLLSLPACAPSDEADAASFAGGAVSDLDLAEERAWDHLLDDAAGPLVGRNIEGLRTTKVGVDVVETTHVRVRQLVDDVPVWEAEAIVHVAPDGEILGLTDDLIDDVAVNTTPEFTADEAVDLAVSKVEGGWADVSDEPVADLWVLRHDEVDHLVWRVQLQRINLRHDDDMPVLFVDAHSGELVWTYDNFQTVACSGTTNFYGTVAVDCYESGGTYYLEDEVDRLGTWSYNHTTTTRSSVTSASTTYGTSTTTVNAVEAHYVSQQVHSYYSSTFARNGIDGAGGPGGTTSHGFDFTNSATSYSTNYVNASWDPVYLRMLYGDGDGVNSGSLTTLDIGGHEMTHGVTQFEANLTYSGESGGLNESMSDVFGAMVERSVLGESANTWLVGEETWTPSTSGDALRYMDTPSRDGASYNYYFSGISGANVHYSSGPANRAFYLLSEGGTGVTAIGADAAASIWYLALTSYMTSSTNFAGARTATLSAAAALYGTSSVEYASVGQAWAAVFVDPTIATYRTSLIRTGRTAYNPSSTGLSVTSAAQTLTLEGPSSADFDLYLQKKSGKSWSTVASNTSSDTTKTLSYAGTSGTYRAYVVSASGGGNYTLGWKK